MFKCLTVSPNNSSIIALTLLRACLILLHTQLTHKYRVLVSGTFQTIKQIYISVTYTLQYNKIILFAYPTFMEVGVKVKGQISMQWNLNPSCSRAQPIIVFFSCPDWIYCPKHNQKQIWIYFSSVYIQFSLKACPFHKCKNNHLKSIMQ